MKLEATIKKAVFLAPKVYGYITKDDKEIIKVKGLKFNKFNKLSYQDLVKLLVKDYNITRTQEKWFKDFSNSTIKIKDQLYTLKVTENKRELIYYNKILLGTKPFIINPPF